MIVKRTRYVEEEYEVEVSIVIVARLKEYCGMGFYSPPSEWCFIKNCQDDIEKAKKIVEEYNKNSKGKEYDIRFLTKEEIEKIKRKVI